jgi:hypothetical protein
MNFNQEYIKQLAEGKAILGNTRLKVDKSLFQGVVKKVGTAYGLEGIRKYYLFDGEYWNSFDIIDKKYQHLHIIPLHDFVSPTKEEKQTIKSIDARLKELEGLVKGKGYTILAKEEQPKMDKTLTDIENRGNAIYYLDTMAEELSIAVMCLKCDISNPSLKKSHSIYKQQLKENAAKLKELKSAIKYLKKTKIILDKTTQGLKTLAEYMGLKASDKKSILDYEDNEVSIHSLTYNTSWDALVPLYAKACIDAQMYDIFTPLYVKVWQAVDTDNKQLAFEAVVELVNLINKENGK